MNKKKISIIVSVVILLTAMIGSFWYVKKQVVNKRNNVFIKEQEEVAIKNKISQPVETKEMVSNKTDILQKEIEQSPNRPEPANLDDWKTAKWKTYEDKKNGFKFQYPDSHFIDKNYYRHPTMKKDDVILRHYESIRYLKELNYPPVPEGNNVIISILENENVLSLRDWVIKNNNYYGLACNNDYNSERIKCEDGGIDSQVKIITINKKEALLISEYSIGNSIVLFPIRNKMIQFYFNGNIDYNDGDNFFRKMMESFEIIR